MELELAVALMEPLNFCPSSLGDTHQLTRKKKKWFMGLVMSVNFKETKQKQEQNLQR